HSTPTHADAIFGSVNKSKGFDEIFVHKDNAEQTAIYENAAKQIKASMAEVQTFMKSGRYAEAKQKLDGLLNQDFSDKSKGIVSLDGASVLRAMNGVGVDGLDTLNVMSKQLGFVTNMEKAGVLADFPPTEKQ